MTIVVSSRHCYTVDTVTNPVHYTAPPPNKVCALANMPVGVILHAAMKISLYRQEKTCHKNHWHSTHVPPFFPAQPPTERATISHSVAM